ncbi:MAG: hypothetical protein WBB39_00330 [Candidatus Saccharimonadales bacterium]
MKRLQIAVIGSAGPEEYPYTRPNAAMYRAAELIGELLGKRNCIVINGGKGGVMEAVCKGAKRTGAITVAEIAANGRGEGNKFVDVEIVTGDVAYRGPSQLIGMSDAVISIGGGAGTLQEIAVAYRMKKPIILITGYGGWTDRLEEDYLDERRLTSFVRVDNVRDAVRCAVATAKEQTNGKI